MRICNRGACTFGEAKCCKECDQKQEFCGCTFDEELCEFAKEDKE